LAGLALVALLAAACGGGGGSPTAVPSPTRTAAGSTTPTPAASVALPTPITSPVVVAGITLYPFDAWIQQGRGCALRLGTEGSYAAPELYSIHREELPDVRPAIGGPSWEGVCKSGDVTAIAYESDDTFVILTNGPHEWLASVPGAEVPGVQISVATVAGRPAALLTVSQSWAYTAMVVVAEEFGLTVVFSKGTAEDATRTAEAIDREHIQIPQGKDTFSGTLNGIRFYDYGHGENRKEGCAWGGYDGVESPHARGVDIPPDTPLDVLPSYLPEGYSLFEKTGTSCGGTVDLVQAFFSLKPGADGFSVRRFSGEAAWFSPYSEDWLTPGTVAGHSAVFIAPPAWASYMTYMPIEVVVKEDFGLTVVSGQISLEEAKRVAAGLNR